MFLLGNPEGRKSPGRPRHKWENNIKMDCREIAGGIVDLINLAQSRHRWQAVVNTVMNFQVLYNVQNYLTS
jgi:hypothetical protein